MNPFCLSLLGLSLCWKAVFNSVTLWGMYVEAIVSIRLFTMLEAGNMRTVQNIMTEASTVAYRIYVVVHKGFRSIIFQIHHLPNPSIISSHNQIKNGTTPMNLKTLHTFRAFAIWKKMFSSPETGSLPCPYHCQRSSKEVGECRTVKKKAINSILQSLNRYRTIIPYSLMCQDSCLSPLAENIWNNDSHTHSWHFLLA